MSDVVHNPSIIILAGINGAGKTTASRSVLANKLKVMTFVNADVIAQGLSGFDPDAAAVRAGEIMLEQLHDLAAQRATFAFETTLAGRTQATWLDGLRHAGYYTHLHYFWVNSPDLAIARVAARVKKGGHNIPEPTIRRRYSRSIDNLFKLYIPVVTDWKVWDNSVTGDPELIAKGKREQPEVVVDSARWALIRGSATNG
jgi:predicted ABC-type ATPase